MGNINIATWSAIIFSLGLVSCILGVAINVLEITITNDNDYLGPFSKFFFSCGFGCCFISGALFMVAVVVELFKAAFLIQ